MVYIFALRKIIGFKDSVLTSLTKGIIPSLILASSMVKDRLKLFGLLGIFWIAYFVISRIIFLIYHFDQTSTLSIIEIGTILFLGLRMDLAMMGYWLILTGLLLTAPVQNLKPIARIHSFTTVILLLISTTIVIADLELYSHWGFRMNTTPLFYAGPEAAASVNMLRLVIMFVLFIVILLSFIYFYFKFFSKKISSLLPLPIIWAPVMFLITGCLFIPIRSSFSVAPLNTGVVYFHKTKTFPNHAGINVVWNFFRSLTSSKGLKYPDNFFEGIEPEKILKEMVRSENASSSFLSTPKPNVILIILESFTSKIIEPLGGLPDITPRLNQLTHEGILFDNFYASGDRTDKGLIAILSAYPAQPLSSIIKYPEKAQSLPYLPRSLTSLGYTTSFIYGGDIGFANMESYLTTAGFTHITEDDNFDQSIDNSKWGVADHYVFDRLLQESDSARNPFFKVMLSLSSHEPFEVPMERVIKGNDEQSLFLNSCFYTDKSLGAFIDQAKKTNWWKNTLIIVTADHGHRFPHTEELKDKERFQIPMLWLGGAISKKDTVIQTISGQTDMANTLLSQVGKVEPSYAFSKNILDARVIPFAVYVFNNGFGYIDPVGETIYDFDYKSYIKQDNNAEGILAGKAYMQSLFNDYNSR